MSSVYLSYGKGASMPGDKVSVSAQHGVVLEEVDHPPHYGGDITYEAIKVIEAWGLGFLLGNAIKYICRRGTKLGTTELKDLQKARWYLDRRIKQLEAEQTPNTTLKTVMVTAPGWGGCMREGPAAEDPQLQKEVDALPGRLGGIHPAEPQKEVDALPVRRSR